MLHAWTSPDPIQTAIERHRAAIDAYRHAPSLITNDDVDAATDSLVATACTTRFGALALLDHLRWWLKEEAEFAAGHQPSYRVAFDQYADRRPGVVEHASGPPGRPGHASRQLLCDALPSDPDGGWSRPSRPARLYGERRASDPSAAAVLAAVTT